MPLKSTKLRIISFGLILSLLTSCFHPPFNNFRKDRQAARKVAVGTGFGAAAGGLIGGTLTGALIGAGAGGAVGSAWGYYKGTKAKIVKDLRRGSIQFIEYGDTMTLIVPVDKYYIFNSARLNEVCYQGLVNIIRLLRLYPQSPVYVAAFTDNVGSRRHKKWMSQAQAETMLGFLWANGVKAYRLKAEGYGDKHPIGEDSLIHGSAYNRRVEIQWFTGLVAEKQGPVFFTK